MAEVSRATVPVIPQLDDAKAREEKARLEAILARVKAEITPEVNRSALDRVKEAIKSGFRRSGVEAGRSFGDALNGVLATLKVKEINLKADPTNALVEVRRVEAQLKKLDTETADPKIKADISEALRALQVYKTAANEALRKRAVQVDTDINRASLAQAEKHIEAGFAQAGVEAAKRFGETLNAALATLPVKKVNIDADPRQALDEVQRLRRVLIELSREHHDPAINLQIGEALRKLDAYKVALKEAIKDQTAEIKLNIEMTAAQAKIAELNGELKTLGIEPIRLSVESSQLEAKLFEVKQQLRDIKNDVDIRMHLRLEAADALAKLEALEKRADFTIHGKVEIDSAQARIEMSLLSRLFQDVGRDSRVFSSALDGNTIRLFGTQRSVAGVIAVLATMGPVVVAAVPAVVALASSLALASASALAGIPALVGFTGAAAAVFGALEGPIGAFKAFLAVEKDVGVNATAAAQKQAALALATQALADAQVNGAQMVVDAQLRLKEAEQAYVQAKEDATRRIVDLNFQATGSALSVEAAQISLLRAQAALVKVNQSATATALDRREANLRVAEAELHLKEAIEKSQRARVDANVANAQGVAGAPAVVKAQDNLQRAHENVAKAQRNASRAIEAATVALGAANIRVDAGTAAQQRFAKEMAKLSPAGKDFVGQLISMQQASEGFQKRLQTAALPGFTKFLKDATGLAPILTGLLVGMAREAGGLASRLGDLTKTNVFRNDLLKMTTGATRAFHDLGLAVVPVIGAVTTLGAEATPILERFASAVRRAAEQFGGWIEAKRASGELAKFMKAAGDEAAKWASIVGNFLSGFVNILIAANPMGRQLATNLKDVSKHFKDWTSTNIEGMRQFFAVTIAAAAGPLAALVTVFKDLAIGLSNAGPGLADLSHSLDKVLVAIGKLLPPIGHLIGAIAKDLAAAIHDAILPVLSALIDILKPMVEWLSKNTAAVYPLIAAWLIFKNAIFFQAVKMLGIELLALVAPLTAAKLGAVGFSAALDANLIGTIVLGITGLTTALIILQTKFHIFDDWTTWKTIVVALGAAFVALKLKMVFAPLLNGILFFFSALMGSMRETIITTKATIVEQGLLGGSMTTVGKAAEGLKGKLSNITSFLGGTWGIALIAAGAGLTYIMKKQDDAKKSTRDLEGGVLALAATYRNAAPDWASSLRSIVEQNPKLADLNRLLKENGISVVQLAGAFAGSAPDVESVSAALKDQIKQLESTRWHLDNLWHLGRSQSRGDQIRKLKKLLDDLTKGTLDVSGAQQLLNQKNLESLKPVEDLAAKDFLAAKAKKDVAAASNALRQMLDQEHSAVVNQIDAGDRYQRSLLAVQQSLKDNGASLDNNTTAGLNNRDAIKAAAQASLDQMLQDIASNVPINDATQWHKDRTKSLEDEAVKSGVARGAAHDLLVKYGDIKALPDLKKRIELEAKTEKATQALKDFFDTWGANRDPKKAPSFNFPAPGSPAQAAIDAASGKRIQVQVTANTDPAATALNNFLADKTYRDKAALQGGDIGKRLGGGLDDEFKRALGISSPSKIFISHGEDIISGLIQGLGKIHLSDVVIALGNTIVQGFKDLLGIKSPSTVMARIGSDALQGFINGLTNPAVLIGAVTAIGAQLLGELAKLPAKMLSAAAPIGAGIVQGIINGIAGGVPSLVSKLGSLVGDVAPTLSGVFGSKGSEIGKALVKGIQGGIAALTPDLKAGGGSMADDFLNHLSNRFGTHSPSTLTRAMGVDLLQGLINGMLAKVLEVQAASSSVTGAIISPFAGMNTTLLGSMNDLWKQMKSGFATAAGDVGTSMSTMWNTGVKPNMAGILQTMSDTFATVQRSVISPFARIMDTHLPNVFDTGTKKMGRFFDQIKPAMEGTSNYVQSRVAPPLARLIDTHLPNTFKHGVSSIGKFFSKVGKATQDPTNWVISEVYDKGFGHLWNVVAGVIGEKKVPWQPPISGAPPAFTALARGGVIPGQSWMGDNVIIKATPGERVLSIPQVAAFGGHGAINKMILAAGGPPSPNTSQYDSMGTPRYAAGGPVQRFASVRPVNFEKLVKDVQTASPGHIGLKYIAAQAPIYKSVDRVAKPSEPYTRGLGKAVNKEMAGLQAKVDAYDSAVLAMQNGGGGAYGIGTGQLGDIQKWIQAQAGKPYVFGASGTSSYDCSSLVGAVWELVNGQTPGPRIFSTSNESNFFAPGRGSLMQLTAGWTNNAGGGVGHTVGEIGGLPFEATPPHVLVGKTNYRVDSKLFDHIGHTTKSVTGALGQPPGGAAGGGVSGNVSAWIKAALSFAHMPSSWQGPYETLVRRESGGNPNAQSFSSNGPLGYAIGLAQLLSTTFANYRDRRLPASRTDPIANLVASINYVQSRYGSIFNVQQAVGAQPNPGGYGSGGIVKDIYRGVMDSGGMIPPGKNLISNLTRENEYLFNNQQTHNLINKAAGPAPNNTTVKVYIGDEEITSRCRTVVHEEFDGVAGGLRSGRAVV